MILLKRYTNTRRNYRKGSKYSRRRKRRKTIKRLEQNGNFAAAQRLRENG